MDTSSFSVLRVKRKADETPLNALVIEESSRRAHKRFRERSNPDGGGLGVFRLVQTVQSNWVGQGAEGVALRDRIAELLSQPATSNTELASKTDSNQDDSQTKPPSAPSVPSEDVLPNDNSSSNHPSSNQAPRLRVIKPMQSRSAVNSNRMRMPAGRMGGLRSDVAEDSNLRFIDAAYDDDYNMDAHPIQSREEPISIPSRTSAPPKEEILSEEDKKMLEMQNSFMPLIQQTLAEERSRPTTSSSNTKPVPDLSTPIKIAPPPLYLPTSPMYPSWQREQARLERARNPQPSPMPTTIPADEDGIYVYDLYYRDMSDLAANGASGNGMASGMNGLVGALSGFEDYLDGEDPGSDTEEGDEADEDSNDEDFYRNDYPDDPEDEYGFEPSDEEEAYHQQDRNYRYGNEDEQDRDGFESEEEVEHPIRALERRLRLQDLGMDGDEDDMGDEADWEGEDED